VTMTSCLVSLGFAQTGSLPCSLLTEHATVIADACVYCL
jgi:hypothetical protein